MAFSAPGLWELMIIFFIVLIIFGAGKLPQVGRQMGSAINEFKNSMKETKPGEETMENKEAE